MTDAIRLASCEGKHRFETRTAAERVRVKMARRHSRGPALGVYRCEYCGGWHIGGSDNRGKKTGRNTDGT